MTHADETRQAREPCGAARQFGDFAAGLVGFTDEAITHLAFLRGLAEGHAGHDRREGAVPQHLSLLAPPGPVPAETAGRTRRQHIQIEPKNPTVKGPAAWFTGDVYIDAVHARKAEPSRMACGWVHFTPRARTAWHSHAIGQTLLITEGVALLGARDGTVIVARPGQVVYTAPGEEHGHGAGPGNFMAHIALYEGTEDGDGATWLELVTDGQYAAATTIS